MDNRKLLKFLYKDIAEIEELVQEKGSHGFDEFEIEFVQSRFKGAKQIIQILSEKENKQAKNIIPRPPAEMAGFNSKAAEAEVEEVAETEKSVRKVVASEEESLAEELVTERTMPNKEDEKESAAPQAQLSVDEEASLQSLTQFEEEVKDNAPSALNELEVDEVNEEEPSLLADPQADSNVELDDEENINEANHRLGDSFFKEKSVNELLGNVDNNKLEYKISNSPVLSIKAAIGINDRYQYIRELFEGNGDAFAKTVTDLDDLNTIQEAVNYLQQNYKWKKNETSLKFVNLIKRRFANG